MVVYDRQPLELLAETAKGGRNVNPVVFSSGYKRQPYLEKQVLTSLGGSKASKRRFFFMYNVNPDWRKP
jgi:hypothetical protein